MAIRLSRKNGRIFRRTNGRILVNCVECPCTEAQLCYLQTRDICMVFGAEPGTSYGCPEISFFRVYMMLVARDTWAAYNVPLIVVNGGSVVRYDVVLRWVGPLDTGTGFSEIGPRGTGTGPGCHGTGTGETIYIDGRGSGTYRHGCGRWVLRITKLTDDPTAKFCDFVLTSLSVADCHFGLKTAPSLPGYLTFNAGGYIRGPEHPSGDSMCQCGGAIFAFNDAAVADPSWDDVGTGTHFPGYGCWRTIGCCAGRKIPPVMYMIIEPNPDYVPSGLGEDYSCFYGVYALQFMPWSYVEINGVRVPIYDYHVYLRSTSCHFPGVPDSFKTDILVRWAPCNGYPNYSFAGVLITTVGYSYTSAKGPGDFGPVEFLPGSGGVVHHFEYCDPYLERWSYATGGGTTSVSPFIITISEEPPA